MLKFTVGLDIAKSVFQVHAIGAYSGCSDGQRDDKDRIHNVRSLSAPVIKKQPPGHIHSSSPPAVTRNSISHSCHISRQPFC
ncbi:hypothetical protein ACHNHQ_005009, partial [Salmonella enterica]